MRPPLSSLEDQTQNKIGLLQQCTDCTFVVDYKALPDEPDLTQIPLVRELCADKPVYHIPLDAKITAGDVATKIQSAFPNQRGLLLIPGRQFDTLGTRHGRGHGWYDQLLAALPKNYLRVGVTDEAHFFAEPLVRKAWDEPMDWVLCEQGEEWLVWRTENPR